MMVRSWERESVRGERGRWWGCGRALESVRCVRRVMARVRNMLSFGFGDVGLGLSVLEAD